jgi:hypothetical protein
MSFMGTMGNSQPDRRHTSKAKDQHGRKWMVVIEKKAMSPCYVTPMFTAPPGLVPPTHLLSFPGELPTDIVIDYDRWEREMQTAWDDYHDRRAELEQIAHGESPSQDYSKPPTRQVAKVLGKPPVVTVEQIRRMRDGDRELLGLAVKAKAPAPKSRKRETALAEA